MICVIPTQLHEQEPCTIDREQPDNILERSFVNIFSQYSYLVKQSPRV